MGILALIVLGALIGWLSKFFVASKGGLGWNIIIGIVGAVVGGLIMQLLGFAGITGFNLYSIAVGILGAVVFVSLTRAVS